MSVTCVQNGTRNLKVLENRSKNGDTNSVTEALALRWEPPTALQQPPLSTGRKAAGLGSPVPAVTCSPAPRGRTQHGRYTWHSRGRGGGWEHRPQKC